MRVDEEGSNTIHEEVLCAAGGIIKLSKDRKISLVYHGFVYVSLTV